MPDKNLHEANRQSWNAATVAHNSHKRDQAGFLRGGGSTLFPDEVELLGELHGKSLVHLQCNAGQDTLSIASKLGAQVTGVDISDEAITFATRLSADSGIPATFIRSDVFDWFATNTTQYDTVFSSYGAIIWLSDITAWGRGVADALKPGGRFVLLEFHPVLMMFEDDMQLKYSAFGGQHVTFEDGIGDYVAMSDDALTPMGYEKGVENFVNPHPTHEFQWGVSDVITALLDAGLTLRLFREYAYTNGFKPFGVMEVLPNGRYALPADWPRIPHMYAVIAERTGT